jgi:N-acetylmuramic acid 6-phosphate etherase
MHDQQAKNPSESPSEPRTPIDKARAFLQNASQYHLGGLPTEKPHPLTMQLSTLAQTDLLKALEVLRQVDLSALQMVEPSFAQDLAPLTHAIEQTLREGGKIYLCGCGATGRLALCLESLWREALKTNKSLTTKSHYGDSIISFMAGGDYALVRSIENFEDHAEYGERQLDDLGFSARDLFIGASEGGETPFVIGATEGAARRAPGRSYFIYCNPDEVLRKTARRSAEILDHPDIHKICLYAGPMALAGSTRLQATTVLMLAIGSCLFSQLDSISPEERLTGLRGWIEKADLQALASLIEKEAQAYENHDPVVHQTADYGLTLLTDLTERSPTFSLLPFENFLSSSDLPAWTYLCVRGATSAHVAWRAILGREPRALNWPEYEGRYSEMVLDGFDFSHHGLKSHAQALESAAADLNIYSIDRSSKNEMLWSFAGANFKLRKPDDLLLENLFLKILINMTSTLVMGRLQRFEGNLMLWVRASNHKLVDRSIRYIEHLLKARAKKAFSYEDITLALFEVLDTLPSDQSVVLQTLDLLISREAK